MARLLSDSFKLTAEMSCLWHMTNAMKIRHVG